MMKYRLLLLLISVFSLLCAIGPDVGNLIVTLADMESKQAIEYCQVEILDTNHKYLSDENGFVRFRELPAGEYELIIKKIGYKEVNQQVVINKSETTVVKIEMKKKAVEIDGITVISSRDEREMVQPVNELSNQKLNQSLSTTIAKTLSEEPGMDYISMGPAPSRPVLRGLGGSRLTILEDEDQTGDISGTSSDHAVAIEPMTASRIEVIRGPEALIYGANNIGGVINIDRGYIPETEVESISGILSSQAETVNQGLANSITLDIPLSLLTFKMDGSFRNTKDIKAPHNTLKNSYIQTLNGSFGLSLIRQWGMMGTAVSNYKSEYGIPGGFVGGHPNGVKIKMQRFHSESKGIYDFTDSTVKYLEINHNYSHYYHEELERSDLIGVSFDLYSHKIKMNLVTYPWLFFSRSVIGLWGETKDYRIGGLSFAPDIIKNTFAVYNYNEIELNKWLLKTSVRFDYHEIDPDDDEEGTFNPLVGMIRKRIFRGISFSSSGNYLLSENLQIGATMMKTFRAPLMEELFSQGPHLAAYSYEIGNADLTKETGWGYELNATYEKENFSLQIAGFLNVFDNYIYLRNTGETQWSLLLPIYKNEGLDAVMKGLDGTFSWNVLTNLKVGGNISYVRGDLAETKQPLPYIPPLKAKIDVNYMIKNHTLGSNVNIAASQNRLGEFEEATDGFITQDLYGRFILITGNLQHSIDISLENVFNTEYRRHLSKIKSIMPEPGRNLKILYKLYF